MKLRLTNLRLCLDADESELINLAARKLRLGPEKITDLKIIKKVKTSFLQLSHIYYYFLK